MPDSVEFPFDYPEVVGEYMLVRLGLMRVPDIAVPEWNKLSPAHNMI